MPRTGARARATKSAASVVTPLRIASCCKAALLTFQLLHQPLELADIPLGEFAVTAEMSDQRGHPATEEAVEKALALSREPFLAGERRRVDEPAPVLARAYGGLLQKASEQSLDR